jgi:hypothetical protein
MTGELFPPAPLVGVIASYPSYQAALGAVDRLAAERFPLHRLSIVAADVRYIERVTGRAACRVANGVAGGAVVGAASGLTLQLLGWADPLLTTPAVALAGLLPGAVVGCSTPPPGRTDCRAVFRRQPRDEPPGAACRLGLTG